MRTQNAIRAAIVAVIVAILTCPYLFMGSTLGVFNDSFLRMTYSVDYVLLVVFLTVGFIPALARPLPPIFVTLFTICLYLSVGQLTYNWMDWLMGFNDSTAGRFWNYFLLILSVLVLLNAPSGEVKRGEIARIEFGKSPIFGLNLIIGEGACIVPHFFGWEVLEYQITISLEFEKIMLSGGGTCSVTVPSFFTIAVPSRFHRFDLKNRILPTIAGLIEPTVSALGAGMTTTQFTTGGTMNQINTNVEATFRGRAGIETLDRFGLRFEEVRTKKPVEPKATSKTRVYASEMQILTALGVSASEALKTAMIASGDVLAVAALTGKGGGKAPGMVVDDDDGKGKGKAGGKPEEPKVDKKLSDPPKSKKMSLAVIILLAWWLVLGLIHFLGWGHNQPRVAGRSYPDKLIPEALQKGENLVAGAFPQPARTLPRFVTLVDNGEGKWITAPATDMEGWLDVSLFPDNPLHNEGCYIRFANSPDTDEILVEKELKDGSVIQYASKGADWIMKARGHDQMSVKPLDVGDKAKKIRIKLINPGARLGLGPLQIEVERR